MAILFISDLHLDVERPLITRLFLDFLRKRAAQAQALYILGDLFEVWLGDDAITPEQEAVTRALCELGTQGTSLYVMHGNRDFLLGEDFARASGCQLLADPAVIDLYGRPTLLMHGDTLCTDDHEYQIFRAEVRNPVRQREFLSLPVPKRLEIATHYRTQSRERSRLKQEYIMDVNQQAVLQAMREHQVTQLIHGHTHRPATHIFDLDGQQATRLVLGDWYEHGSFLNCDASGCHAETLRTQATILTG